MKETDFTCGVPVGTELGVSRAVRKAVVRENGIEVPTLCYEPKLPGFGACRMCVVEVEGEDAPPISCSKSA